MLLATAITIRIGTEIVTTLAKLENKSAVVKSGAPINDVSWIVVSIEATNITTVRPILIRTVNVDVRRHHPNPQSG